MISSAAVTGRVTAQEGATRQARVIVQVEQATVPAAQATARVCRIARAVEMLEEAIAQADGMSVAAGRLADSMASAAAAARRATSAAAAHRAARVQGRAVAVAARAEAVGDAAGDADK